MTEREIFVAALEKSTPEERATYLQKVCGEDQVLRRKVEELLEEHFSNDDLLQQRVSNTVVTQVLSSPAEEGAGSQIHQYKLLQKLGEGGFGIVYMAEQKVPVKRRVALKIIKLGMDTRQVVARFEAERQALAMMDHPNIAKVLDAGATETGRPYFVMELVKGVPITQFCDERLLSTNERMQVFILVCQAVQHAHQKGIIHRDLKPSNILITLHDGVPVPKVIDFGIAKATQQELTEKTLFTQFGQFIGTPAYMSPEQAELSGLDIDTRSDIYSLGVLLYELLVGHTPLDVRELLARGYDELRRGIKEQEPLKPSTKLDTLAAPVKTTVARQRNLTPSELSRQLRGDLDWIVLKALEKDRTRRYETANGLASDIKRYLANEPVTAMAPSASYLLRKYAQRHKAVLAVAAAIAAILIVATVVSTSQAIRATRASAAERKQALAALKARDESKRLEQLADTARESERAARLRADQQAAEAQHLLYVANMNLVQLAWEDLNAGRARQLLRDTFRHPDRGFEWFYWQREVHQEVYRFAPQTGWIVTAAFAPDGRRMVTGGGNQWDDAGRNVATVWDFTSRRPLFTLEGHGEAINSAAFSPDGKKIMTGSLDRTAKLWDASTGQHLIDLQGHADWVVSVAFSPDGQRVATASKDGSAKVWDPVTGKELLTYRGHQRWINSIAYFPDGRRLVTGSDDGTATVWDARTGTVLLTFTNHTNAVQAVAVSPDGSRIVTGSEDQTGRIWDAIHGQELSLLRGHRDRVTTVAFSPDGRRVTTGSADQTVRVWDAATGQALFALPGHSDIVWSVAYSPDGRYLLSGGDQTALLWDATGPKKGPLTLQGHGKWVSSAHFSPDGSQLLSGSAREGARLWNLKSGQTISTFGNDSRATAISKDGRWLFTVNSNATVAVWEASTGQLLFSLPDTRNNIQSFAVSPDSQRVATGDGDGVVKVWDVGLRQVIQTIQAHPPGNGIFGLAFAPDGQRLATGSFDRTARIWDIAAGKPLLTLSGHSRFVVSVAYSPEGRRVLTASGDKTAKIWDTTTGKDLLTLRGHGEQLRSAVFSPDGRRILTGSLDHTAKLWDPETGQPLLTLKGHRLGVISAAWSRDGRRIATGSMDATVKVWDVATAEEIAEDSRVDAP